MITLRDLSEAGITSHMSGHFSLMSSEYQSRILLMYGEDILRGTLSLQGALTIDAARSSSECAPWPTGGDGLPPGWLTR